MRLIKGGGGAAPTPPPPPRYSAVWLRAAVPGAASKQRNAAQRPLPFLGRFLRGRGGGSGTGRTAANRSEPHREPSGSRPRAEAAFPPEGEGGGTGTVTAGKCVGEEREERGTDGAGRGRRKGGGGEAPQVPTAAPAVTDRRAALRPPSPPTPAPGSGAAGPAHAVWGGMRLRMARSFRADRAAERSRTGPGRAAQGRKRRAPPGGPRPALLPASPRWRHRERRRRQRGADARPRGGESPPPEGSGRAGGNPPRGAAAVNRERLLRFPADISGTDCGVGGRPSRRGAPIPAWGGGGSRRHAARTFGRCRFWCRCRRAAGAAPVLAALRDASAAPTGLGTLGTRRHLKGPQRFAAGGGSSKGTPPFPLSPAGNAAFPPLPSAALGRSTRARDSVIPRRAGPGRPPGTRRQSPIWQGQAGALCAARWGGGWGRLTCPPAEGSCHRSPAPSRSPT